MGAYGPENMTKWNNRVKRQLTSALGVVAMAPGVSLASWSYVWVSMLARPPSSDTLLSDLPIYNTSTHLSLHIYTPMTTHLHTCNCVVRTCVWWQWHAFQLLNGYTLYNTENRLSINRRSLYQPINKSVYTCFKISTTKITTGYTHLTLISMHSLLKGTT